MVCVFPGSFDPWTFGHENILYRASALFDSVIIVIANNSSKKYLMSLQDRKKIIDERINHFKNDFVNNIKSVIVEGLVAEWMQKNKYNLIIKGLRKANDFEYEMEIALLNNKLYENIETIFIPTNNEYQLVRSSLVKEIWKYGGDISWMVPECVIRKLNDYK